MTKLRQPTFDIIFNTIMVAIIGVFGTAVVDLDHK